MDEQPKIINAQNENLNSGPKNKWFVEASPILFSICLAITAILLFAVIGLGVDNARKDQEIASLNEEIREKDGKYENENENENGYGWKGDNKIDTYAEYNENLGKSVDYRVEINGIALDDWKLFYQDDEADYLIYGGYLPNSTNLAKNAGLTQGTGEYADFGVYSNASRNDLLARLNGTRDKTLWDALLTNEMKSRGATARGGVDVETWVRSWNAKGYDELELSTYDFVDGSIGYTIDGQDMRDLSKTDGYSDELYFPRINDRPEATSPYRGYWVASESMGMPYVMIATDQGGLAHNIYGVYDTEGVGIRPVIIVPREN